MSISTFRHSGKKIVAIGRNFGAHAKELGNAVPTSPFFFLKPTTSYLDDGGTVLIPKGVEAHFEVELGVVVGKEARDRNGWAASLHSCLQMSCFPPPAASSSHCCNNALALALGIDMTARNLQDKAKKAGLPWSAAKGFDTFNPVSSLIEKSKIADPHNVRLWLAVSRKGEGSRRMSLW
ncbi:Predicted fumarylacetoacetate hydralase [Ceraceosorus bombacis]|uniref:Predicted fumarylacetoacetate hydralase n=1 Tax=Ceraceosorus bombacis TaxID=401625 RepID=A0A0N7L8S8_9BASI|nr:Predicted fumarylacetoacetate hydralase [Ceraceosorus bombacis]